MPPRPGVAYGPLEYAEHNTILRTLVGSSVHGVAVEGTDDRDELGVYVEPPDAVLGARPMDQRAVWRTQPEGVRSGPGDIDLVMYSLRHYMDLAMKGNPTVLTPLFAPTADVLEVDELGERLRALRWKFLTLSAVRRFVGYLDSQHERMMGGGKRNRVPNRPELIKKYGWDVKYGSHALRLSIQGLEVVATGRLTLPMPPTERDIVLGVKRGEYDREMVSWWITRQRRAIVARMETNPAALPEYPDRDAMSAFMVDAHRSHWGF